MLRLFGGTNSADSWTAAGLFSEDYLKAVAEDREPTAGEREVAVALRELWHFAGLQDPSGSPRFPVARASLRSPDSQRLLALMAANAATDPAKLQTLNRYIALLIGTDVREILGR